MTLPRNATILQRIVSSTAESLAKRKIELPLSRLRASLPFLPRPRDFRAALDGDRCAIIAEIKRSSPSAGRILRDFDPPGMAGDFEKGGAAALSVLTEEHFFEGNLSYIEAVKHGSSLPVLRKDFIIDPYQVYETRVHGGDALLLIAGLLGREGLKELLSLAGSLGLASLVEVNSREDIEIALSAGAQIVGINNRNLDTFETDLGTSEILAPLVPEGTILVSESGIGGNDDIRRLQKVGIKAFLVGEFLSRSPDREKALKSLRNQEAQR